MPFLIEDRQNFSFKLTLTPARASRNPEQNHHSGEAPDDQPRHMVMTVRFFLLGPRAQALLLFGQKKHERDTALSMVKMANAAPS